MPSLRLKIAQFIAGQKSVGTGILSGYLGQSGDSPRPTMHNMREFLTRYADQAWVFSCINKIQTKGAGVPLKMYQVKSDGALGDELPMHPLKKLVDACNPFMTGYSVREATHGFEELVGNAYWILDAFVNGLPTEIYPVNPSRMRIKADKAKYVTGYIYESSPGVDPILFDASEVLHFKNWNPLDDWYGMPPLSAARDSSDALMYADRYNKVFFENGAEPSGILTATGTLDDGVVERILQSWRRLHQGQRKAHKVAVLDGGLTWQSTALAQKDMAFENLKKMSREDVLTVYGVPPVMVGVYEEGATYNNAQEQRRIFWLDSMVPRLRKHEDVINMKLVKPYAGGSVIAKFDLSEVEALQKDEKLGAEKDEILTRSGIMLINEARKLRKLPPVTWGDTWNAPINLMPIDEVKPEPAAPAPTPPPADKPKEPKKETVELSAPTEQEKSMIRRGMIWEAFKSSTEARERKWRSALYGLFNLQEREVKDTLRSHWQHKATQARLDGGKTTKSAIDAIIFDGGQARKMFRKTGRQLLEYTLQAAAVEEAERYGLTALNLINPRVTRWLDEKSFKFSDEVNSTTEAELRAGLEEALNAGESIDDVAKRIESIFDAARGYRADAIARTEVISASNKGAVELYTESGVQKVEWVSSRDAKVRETHQIDGQVRDISSPFTNGLEYPGDPSGAPEEVINCRCTVAPIIEK